MEKADAAVVERAVKTLDGQPVQFDSEMVTGDLWEMMMMIFSFAQQKK